MSCLDRTPSNDGGRWDLGVGEAVLVFCRVVVEGQEDDEYRGFIKEQGSSKVIL